MPVKFNWFNKNGEVANDESEGVILKLRFLLKDGVKRGKFSIGFKYSDGDGKSGRRHGKNKHERRRRLSRNNR